MSDICDDADDVRRLSEGGARFKGAFAKQRGIADTVRKPCKKCKCQPILRSFCGAEILACPACMRQTPPLKSRQALQAMWNDMN